MPFQDQDTTVQELLARIATLEKKLEEQRNLQVAKVEPMPDYIIGSPSGSSNFTGSMSPSIPPSLVSQGVGPPHDDETGLFRHLAHEVFTTTSTLAQLSFGHHGEHVDRGTFICALRSVSLDK